MALKQAEQTMLRAKSAAVKPVGLTLTQYVALAELDKHPGITGAALARACLVTPQAMMVALKAMQEQGLIERRAHPRHSNVLEIYLTDVGAEAMVGAREKVEPIEQRVTDALSVEEMATLEALLGRYTEAIRSPGDITN
jgi:DNA-binding MarR family transcriptional regulator